MTTGGLILTILLIGLALFLGIHCIRVFAPQWREAQISARGAGPWRGLYSAASIIAFAVLVYGFGLAREQTGILYVPPEWGRSFLHIAMPISLVLFVASQLPPGNLKKRLAHPMLWATIIWAVGHLLANGETSSVILFGAILIWAVICLVDNYKRPQGEPVAAKVWPDLVSMVIGFAITIIFIMFLHQWLIGVPVV